ncbi:MAG: serine hydrolase [Magnetococcales bacterium]|nr:serine hydrolase [Magnetococcales bacterium]
MLAKVNVAETKKPAWRVWAVGQRCLLGSILWALLLLLSTLPVGAEEAQFNTLSTFNSQRVYTPGQHWHKAIHPRMLGWSAKKLDQAQRYAQEKLASSAVVIVDRGVVVAAWGKPAERFLLNSIRKPLMGALFGLHVAAGHIDLDADMKQLGIDDIEPRLTPLERTARVRDLLRSRSGVYHPSAYEPKKMKKNRPARGSYLPGTFYFYNNWDFNTLGGILERESGTGIFQEFDRRIATPLEMEHYRIKDGYYKRQQASLYPAYIFHMSALDLARFGLLYQREGKWRNQQVVPADWVRQSTSLPPGEDAAKKGYGYLWVVYPWGFTHGGSGGQRLQVYTERELVIVHLKKLNKGEKRLKSKAIEKLFEKVLEAKPAPKK